MTEALDTRGQLAIDLDGEKYVLRPSREAVQACERITGKPLFTLAGEAASGQMPLDTMAVCVVEFMKAHGKANPDDPQITTYRAVKVERIADMIYENKSPNICACLAVVLIGALSGGYTASGELKAA